MSLKKPCKKEVQDCDPEEGIKLCNEILDLIEELPESAEEFKDSVQTKVLDIHQWIDSRNHVTEAQMSALENMLAGVEKWIH